MEHNMILSDTQKSLCRAFAEGFRDGIVAMEREEQLEDIWTSFRIPGTNDTVDINLWIPDVDQDLEATVYPCTMGADGYLTTDCDTILVRDLFKEAF
jgi:hypothetical protein